MRDDDLALVVWTRASGLAWAIEGDTVTLLDLDRVGSTPLALTGSSMRIWTAIDGIRSTTAIVESVAGEFGIEPDVIEADVIAFLDGLRSDGLIVGQPSAK